MASFKDCPVIDLGSSVIGQLIIRDGDYGTTIISSTYPGEFTGVIVDNKKIKIEKPFEFVREYHDWIWVYDDIGKMAMFDANTINVYQHEGTLIFVLIGEVFGMYAMNKYSHGIISTYSENDRTDMINDVPQISENLDFEN